MLDKKLLKEYNATRFTRNKDLFCHAPFISMNFAQDGHVTVCCYNRKILLGTYPENSIEEMWYGKGAEQLRTLMEKDILPAGCDICEEQFLSRSFGILKARFYDELSQKKYRGSDARWAKPRVMEFEISNVCNLECTMCNGFFSSSIRHNRERMPQLQNPYDGDFIRQLEEFIPHLVHARFLGGEPFLIKPYYEIWGMIRRLNPRMQVSITTNGTIMNNRVRDTMESLTAHMILSIDSLDRENYERIRVNARYDNVMEQLEYFKSYVRRKGTGLTLAVCPMRQNWWEMPKFLEYCNAEEICMYFNTVLQPPESAFRNMGLEELNEVIAGLERVQLKERSKVQHQNNEVYRGLIRQVTVYRDQKAKYESYQRENIKGSEWKIWLAPENKGNVVLSSEQPEWVRVAIDQVDGKTDWGIQLNKTPISVRSSFRYFINFRARADTPRQIVVGVAQAHEPWQGLGLFLRCGLTTSWQDFETDFVPDSDDGNARIFFRVGGSTVPVELAEVEVRYGA